jgi:hypothetical protein
MKLTEVFMISEAPQMGIQLQMTKGDTLQFIDSVGRIILEVPMEAIEKFGSSQEIKALRDGVPMKDDGQGDETHSPSGLKKRSKDNPPSWGGDSNRWKGVK